MKLKELMQKDIVKRMESLKEMNEDEQAKRQSNLENLKAESSDNYWNCSDYFVFRPDGAFYIMWTFIVFISETYLAIVWAKYAVFPINQDWTLMIIIVFEFVVFCDIISEFFQAYKEEGMDHYVMEFEKIWRRYLYSKQFL